MPDMDYSLQIFKGDNWELIFERSKGIDSLNQGVYVGSDWRLVDLRLQKGQIENHYRVKLTFDGQDFENKSMNEENFNQILNEFATEKMSIQDIKGILELYVDLTR